MGNDEELGIWLGAIETEGSGVEDGPRVGPTDNDGSLLGIVDEEGRAVVEGVCDGWKLLVGLLLEVGTVEGATDAEGAALVIDDGNTLTDGILEIVGTPLIEGILLGVIVSGHSAVFPFQ